MRVPHDLFKFTTADEDGGFGGNVVADLRAATSSNQEVAAPCDTGHVRCSHIETGIPIKGFIVLTVAVFFCFSLWTLTFPNDFIPPVPQTVKESLFPTNSVASGPVHVAAQIDPSGSVTRVKVLRSIASLDEPSIHAARIWKFVPAILDGQARGSFFTISFNYYVLGIISNGEVIPFSQDPSSQVPYTPPIPEVTRQPNYPVNCVAIGSVILLVDVGVEGRVSKTKILKSVIPLDESCIKAARLWRYEPAKLNHRPVQSKAAICFNFDRGSGQVLSNP